MKKTLTLITAVLLILNISIPVFADIFEKKPSDNLTYASYLINDQACYDKIKLNGEEITDKINKQKGSVKLK